MTDPMPDPTPSSPTICAKCEHYNHESLLDLCAANPIQKFDYVTGQPDSTVRRICQIKNIGGACPDYKERQDAPTTP